MAAQAGEKGVAYGYFKQVVAEMPDSALAWVWLGGTTPLLDEAEDAFLRATALEPTNKSALLGMRWAALRRQALRQADDLGVVAGRVSTASHDLEERIANDTATDTAAPGEEETTAQPEMSFFTRLFSKLRGQPVAVVIIMAIVIVYATLLVWWLLSH